MDDLLQYLFLEILGNVLFRIGRSVLRVVTLDSIRLENPTRFQMFLAVVFGLFVLLSFVSFLVWL